MVLETTHGVSLYFLIKHYFHYFYQLNVTALACTFLSKTHHRINKLCSVCNNKVNKYTVHEDNCDPIPVTVSGYFSEVVSFRTNVWILYFIYKHTIN